MTSVTGALSRRTMLARPAAAALAALLTACGPAAGAPQTPGQAAKAGPKKTLAFSTYVFQKFEDAMREVLRTFEQDNPDVEVQAEYATGNYYEKIQSQIAANTTPDVGIASFSWTVSLAKGGALLALDDVAARDKYALSQFLPAGLAQYRWRTGDFSSGGQGGKQYGLPSDAQPFVFFYNRSAFDKAGQAYPTDNWTWNDLLAAAKRLTRADEDKWGVAAPAAGPLHQGNFVFAAGGSYIAPDFKKSGLDRPETIEAYKWAYDLIYTHRVAPVPASGAPHPFTSGRCAMYIYGIWYIADLVKGNPDFAWDVAMQPKHPTTGKRTTSAESDGWWIYKAGKDPDTSWRLLKWLAGEKGQQKFSELEYVIPPSRPNVAKEWYAKKPPEHRSKALDQVVQDSRAPANTYFEAGTVNRAINPIFARAYNNGEDIGPILREATQAMNAELDRAWSSFR
ncbi:MAG: sugar ABC transporter substrate-binding protein [Chloroflexi bacterium]|nr:sugar ABC transporter substrate-binding protein [Chloroflexota bacterium]